MKLKTNILYYTVVILLPFFGFSQIAITNAAEITKIKQGTTFFAMSDPSAPKAKAFVEAIKKAWTLSKVECIKYTDVEKNIAPNNSFVTITANMTTSNSTTSPTETHIYLELWTTNGKYTYDPKKRRHFNQADKITVATLELFPDFSTQNNPSSLYKMDYSAEGHLKNWGAGIIANYMQQLILLLDKAEARLANATFLNKEELKKMSGATLIIPDYTLIKFARNSDDESKKYDEKEIFEGFSQSYKVIPIAELNDKIQNTSSPFYYLLLIKTNSDKYVTITNSLTGEIIYSTYSGSSSNLKSADLKELQKVLLKK